MSQDTEYIGFDVNRVPIFSTARAHFFWDIWQVLAADVAQSSMNKLLLWEILRCDNYLHDTHLLLGGERISELGWLNF
jgi:hypothetical protein